MFGRQWACRRGRRQKNRVGEKTKKKETGSPWPCSARSPFRASTSGTQRGVTAKRFNIPVSPPVVERRRARHRRLVCHCGHTHPDVGDTDACVRRQTHTHTHMLYAHRLGGARRDTYTWARSTNVLFVRINYARWRGAVAVGATGASRRLSWDRTL